MITLWGPTSAGKTALLAYLYIKPPAAGSNWQVFPTALSLPEIERQREKILKANEFPRGTIDTEAVRISYDFKDKSTGVVRTMETIDRAGILAIQNDKALIDSLVESEGIVLLLDCDRIQRETEVVAALSYMYVQRCTTGGGVKGEPDTRPLAVCLSKVDQFIHTSDDLRRVRHNPERFVKDRLSQGLLERLEQFHSRVNFFPVSSVGLNLSFGCVQKPMFLDERLMMRVTEGTPMNVIEPFVWIFETLRDNP